MKFDEIIKNVTMKNKTQSLHGNQISIINHLQNNSYKLFTNDLKYKLFTNVEIHNFFCLQRI